MAAFHRCRGASFIAALVLLLTTSTIHLHADAISDNVVVTVTGKTGIPTQSTTESKDSVKLQVPMQKIRLGADELGNGKSSDTLTIASFSVTLASDTADSTPDPGEIVGPIKIPFSLTSDPSTPDDQLIVDGKMFAAEKLDLFSLAHTVTVEGDTLRVLPIKFTFASDTSKADPPTDGKAESFSGVITITAFSDVSVPEPTSFSLMLLLAGVLVFAWIRKVKGFQ